MWERLRPWLFPVECVGCGRPQVALCRACGAGDGCSVVLEGLTVRAARRYEREVRAAIVALKRGERAYLEPLAALLVPLVPAGSTLIPLPTLRRRAAARGFDQARELARRVGRSAGARCADVLEKRGAAQRGLGRAQRLAARGRFVLRAGAVLPPTALLVDDVVTTGATIADAARVLFAAGCRASGAVVVAATPADRETAARRRKSDGA